VNIVQKNDTASLITAGENGDMAVFRNLLNNFASVHVAVM
jgi:hypothetical protein